MSFAGNLKTGAVSAVLAAAIWLGAGPAQVQAQTPAQTPVEDLIVARVNGTDITRSDLDQVSQDLRDQLSRIPAEQRFSVILNIAIDIRLMARAAEEQGLADAPDVQRRLNIIRDNQLRAEYLRANAFDPVTSEVVEARYQEEIADFVPAEEVRARHILVADEDEAIAIIKQLDEGADFAAIAQEKSIDPGSGRNGGDLDFFGRGAMVKPFSDAAFGLEVGSYTAAPVQSQFGYHIIKVEETRSQPVPTLAERADEIRQALVSEALVSLSESLRDAASLEVMGPDDQMIPLPPRAN